MAGRLAGRIWPAPTYIGCHPTNISCIFIYLGVFSRIWGYLLQNMSPNSKDVLFLTKKRPLSGNRGLSSEWVYPHPHSATMFVLRVGCAVTGFRDESTSILLGVSSLQRAASFLAYARHSMHHDERGQKSTPHSVHWREQVLRQHLQVNKGILGPARVTVMRMVAGEFDGIVPNEHLSQSHPAAPGSGEGRCSLRGL